MSKERERYERWMREAPPEGRRGIPAATVILLRDGPRPGLECLMLKRNSKIAFGGMWVFPGGRIDEIDRVGDDEIVAARRAAMRESQEEAGLDLDEAGLLPFSHWTPPGMTPKRFLTWFFIARAPVGAVTIDDGEIKAHRWIAPVEAMRLRNAGEVELAPPTWITLERLARYATVADALEHQAATAPEIFETRIAMTEAGPVALYEGDAGYAAKDANARGPRHRLEMRDTGWCYERDDWDCEKA